MLKAMKNFTIIGIFMFISGTGYHCAPPVAGVETGNPRVIFCSRIVMELFDNDTAWSPSSFLVNSQAQLNPGILTDQPVGTPKLSKNASMEPQQIIDSGSYYIVVKTDTIINQTIILVKDTVVTQRIKTDTVVQQNESSPPSATSNLISRYLVNDSIFVIDTIVKYDTLTVQRIDTIQKVSDGSQFSIGNIYYTPTIQKQGNIISKDTSGFVVDTRYLNNYAYIPIEKYRTRSGQELIGIVRKSQINNMTIREEYRDADGDGTLHKSVTPAPRLQLFAGYVTPGDSLSLWALFDAGRDLSFDHVTDNRIHTLKKFYKSTGNKHEEVYYGKPEMFSTADTLVLLWNRTFDHDSVSSLTTRYACLPGDDTLDHHQNRLSRLTHSIRFRNSSVNRIQITLTPDTPLLCSAHPIQAAFEAIIDNGRGRMGVLVGTADYSTKRVSGKYSENGVEYEFRYDYAQNIMEAFERL